MSNFRIIISIVFVFCFLGCGGLAEQKRTVLIETEEKKDLEPPATNMDQIVLEDSKLAIGILEEEAGKTGDAASWAAVYSVRLGVKRDEESVLEALRKGVHSEDQLLSALCWRWLASSKTDRIPKWTKKASREPVVAMMAALSYGRRGEVPKALANAFCSSGNLSEGKEETPEDKLDELWFLVIPFDDGPLATAIALAEARRSALVSVGPDKKRVFVADRLRKKLVDSIFGNDEGSPNLGDINKPCSDPMFSELRVKLELSLRRQPLSMVRGVALKGKGSLRIEALRVLAMAIEQPTAGDLGISAAAMRSDDVLVRIEAARTFLLLAARAVE